MSDLIVKPVESREEYLVAMELAARVFSQDQASYDRWIARMPLILSQPDFEFASHRVGVMDGRVVANVIAHPFRLRYGSVEFRTGGIGAVCVDPDYRKQGIAAAVFRDTIDYMIARGDHFSLLDGIANFYPRFGYHTVWPDYTLEFRAADAAALDAPFVSRPATAHDASQMAALYERCWGHRVTLLRSLELWRWRLKTLPPRDVRVVEDHSGQIMGYFTGLNRTGEMVAETAAAAKTLIAEAGRTALAEGQETVSLLLPSDDRLIYDVQRWIPSDLRVKLIPNGNWMGRILDVERFREILLPEVTANAGLDLRGFIFDIQPDAVHLGLRGQDTTNFQLNHGDFLRVMFGSLPPAALDLHADAVQLLQRLFPPRVAMIAPWDWF